MIGRLIHILHNSGLELTAREVAEVLWLAAKTNSEDDIERSVSTSNDFLPAQLTSQQYTDLEASPQEAHRNEEEPASVDQSFSQSTPHRATSQEELQTEPQPGLHSSYSDVSAKTAATVMPFRAPAASALPAKLGIARALRPFRRRAPSRTDLSLDEVATVQRIADTNIWQPVLRPVPTRWLDVALVIDTSASMAIWQQTIVELRQMLAGHGAFRDIRTWSIVTDAEDDQVHLYAGTTPTTERHPRELVDPQGQRLFLIVSDCVSPAWYNGSVAQVLDTWGQRNPVAMVQVLPQRLWMRSALGYATAINMRALSPAAPNKQMEKVALPGQWLERDALVGIAVPVVTLEPEPIATLSQAIAGSGSAWASGVVLALSDTLNDDELKSEAVTRAVAVIESPKTYAQQFRSTASPTARKLAGYLAAAAPLNLSVMRLVQRAMLPQSRQVHLAEVFLGGLLQQISLDHETADPEKVQYDFIDGVREELLNSIAMGDAMDVLNIVYEQIIEQTSTFIEERAGHPSDFAAWLATSTEPGTAGVDKVGQPFATVTATILRRLGGEYTRLAERIDSKLDQVGADAQDFLLSDITPVAEHEAASTPDISFLEEANAQKHIPSLAMVPRLIPNPASGTTEINLESEEWRVLTMVNAINTVDQIAQRSGLGEFRTAEIIRNLIDSGLIEDSGNNKVNDDLEQLIPSASVKDELQQSIATTVIDRQDIEQRLTESDILTRKTTLEKQLNDLKLRQNALEERIESGETMFERMHLQNQIRDFTSKISHLEIELKAIAHEQKEQYTLVLTTKTLKPVRDTLSQLSHNLGTQCIILTDRAGMTLVEVGSTDDLPTMILLPLLSTSFSTAGEVARQLHQEKGTIVYIHEGINYDFYCFNIETQFLLVFIFDKRVASSKIGTVWIEAKRAIAMLTQTMKVHTS